MQCMTAVKHRAHALQESAVLNETALKAELWYAWVLIPDDSTAVSPPTPLRCFHSDQNIATNLLIVPSR
jgi:hypothetical protein